MSEPISDDAEEALRAIRAALERQVGLTALRAGNDNWREADPLLARALDALATLEPEGTNPGLDAVLDLFESPKPLGSDLGSSDA